MQGKIDHELHACCLSSLAMMFFQDPSINQFQMRLQKAWHKNNLQTLFNVNTIDATQYFVSQKINCPKCLYKNYPNLKITIGGDGLYSKQPFIIIGIFCKHINDAPDVILLGIKG